MASSRAYLDSMKQLESRIIKVKEKELVECESGILEAENALANFKNENQTSQEKTRYVLQLDFYKRRKAYLYRLMDSYKNELQEIVEFATRMLNQYFSK